MLHDNRISVRFEYECQDAERPVVAQPWQRALGVRRAGYMRPRDASIIDYRIDEADRRIHLDRD